jgi:RNA polymerase sigma factor (sigma-70 family)
MNVDDAALVAGLRAGDPDAVGAVYARHGADVLRWVIRLGGPRLDAEDVAHEVFLTAIKAARRFRGDARLRTWLFGVTRGVVANARRRAAIRAFVGLDAIAEPADPGPDLDATLAARQARRRVQRALDRLRTSHREVLVLSDLEGIAAPEVAAMLDIPPGTVYSRLHHARKAMAEALAAEGLGADGRPDAVRGDNVVPLRRTP